ncbi:MAG: type II secretion system protein, partial [Elusimicrobiota bacterium]|nr:type II secretion system protein [Elusimicrobiota bacterium]
MKTKKGFTLIELMIVVAIIGILAAIAIPKFADLIKKSKEGSTKGSLGAIRSALTIYYGEQEGVYPKASLTASYDGKTGCEAGANEGAYIGTFNQSAGPFLTKYLDKLPSVKLGITNLSDNTSTIYNSSYDATVMASSGKRGSWWYRGSTGGEFHVACTDLDTK